MAQPNDLTTLANAYGWLGAQPGSDDATLARLITAFSTRIQKWLGYAIATASYTRTFNGQGTRKLYLPDLPVQSVSSVMVGARAIPQGQFSGGAQQAGFYSDAYSVALIGYIFAQGFQNITVTYTAGYAAVPADIEQACLDWMKSAYFRKASGVGPDVSSIRAGDTQMSWGNQPMATADPDLIPIPSAIYAMLADYQRKAQIAGF